MLAASAANLVSLLAFWVLLDVLWLSGASLRPTWEGSPTDGLFMLIPAVGGPLILLVGAVLSIRSGYTAAFSGFSPALSYLLVGAGLARLGVFLPSRSPRRKNEQVSRNPWVARVPASAAGLVLVIRAAEIRAGLPGGKGGGWTLLLVAGLGLALLLWRSRKTLFLSWTLGTYLLTVLAWRYGLPAPALAWGGAFFLVGAVLSYPNHKKFYPRWGAGAAILGLCGLPFTPLGPARQIYLPEHGGWAAAGAAGFFIGSVIVYLLGLGDQEQVSSKPEVSEVILGLGLVVGTQMFVAFPLHTPLTDWELGQEILWGGLPLGVAGGVYFLNVYVLGEFLPLARPHPPGITALREAAAWVIRALFRAAGGPVRLFSDLLEGRGGLVWALLSAFLLISLLMGR